MKIKTLLPLLLPLGALLALAGYVGPWVDHRVAGLAILGLDLGEYVKFLPLVRAGTTGLWREGFYLPLVAVSLALSLCTWRADLRPFTRSLPHGRGSDGAVSLPHGRGSDGAVSLPHGRGSDGAGSVSDPLTVSAATPAHRKRSDTRSFLAWLLVIVQVAASIIAALNLLPPAWTPQRMLTPEFQQQTAALVLCLLAVAFGPLLALIPRRVTGALVLLLSLLAAFVPVQQFLRVLPEISGLYHHPLTPGWGMYVMLLGLALLALLGGWLLVKSDGQP